MTIAISDDHEIKYDPKKHNVYADRIDGSWLHISDAESGQNGYYCQGCGKELVAVKSKLPNRIHFFRHAVMDVQIERKCVYRDFDFRHKLAIELIARLKHVKVPAVYKWPPKGSEGLANFVCESKLIEAHTIEVDRAFYENEIGEIKWGSRQGVDEKHLLVRPDVIFFDAEKNPILFVELAVSHKVDNEKKAKLRRLGIDTIEIIVPKDSPAAIEAALYSSKNIKWIYNHEEECTKYVPVPEGNSKGVPPIDEQQKRLFAETFECRQAEVRNLIRSITRVLESKLYGDSVQQLGEEISRVEGNTKEHQSKLDGLREECRKRVTSRYGERRASIGRQKAEIEFEEEKFGEEEADLEKRYYTKKSELGRDEYQIGREQKIVEREFSGEDEDEDGIGGTNLRTKNDLEFLIENEKSEIGRLEQELEKAPGEYKSDEEAIIKRFTDSTESAKRDIERIEREISELPGKFKDEEDRITGDFQSKEEQLPGEFKSKEGELEREFEELRHQSYQAISSRNGIGNTDIAIRIRKLLEARGVLNDIEPTQKLYRRYRKAKELFNDGTYESWLK